MAFWRWQVHTSDVAGAGTDANVFVNIYGSEGESGPRQLKVCAVPCSVLAAR